MSFDKPVTTGQFLEGGSSLLTVVVFFIWRSLMFTCWGGEGVGLMLTQILIFPSAITANYTFCPNTYIGNTH